MNKIGKIMLYHALSLLLISCSTTTLPGTIDNIHFPRFANVEDRVVVPAHLEGRLKLQDNCIVIEASNLPLDRDNRTLMLIWDADTILSLESGKIKIIHPGGPKRKPLIIGSKVKLYGSVKGASYDPTRLKLRKTPAPTCQPTSNSFEVASW